MGPQQRKAVYHISSTKPVEGVRKGPAPFLQSSRNMHTHTFGLLLPWLWTSWLLMAVDLSAAPVFEERLKSCAADLALKIDSLYTQAGGPIGNSTIRQELVSAAAVNFSTACLGLQLQTQRAVRVMVPNTGLAGLLQSHAKEFEAVTGIRVSLNPVSFYEVVSLLLLSLLVVVVVMVMVGKEIQQELTAGIREFSDGWVIDPAVTGEIASLNGFKSLDEYIPEDASLQWNDISRFFRAASAIYDGKVVAIPLDGDLMLMYYRRDLFLRYNLSVPVTWDDFVQLAEQMNGTDVDGDGVPDLYGACFDIHYTICKANFIMIAMAAPYIQYRGTSQGLFLDPDTMDPLLDNAAMAHVLELYLRLFAVQPPTPTCAASNAAFRNRTCLMTINWGRVPGVGCRRGLRVYGGFPHYVAGACASAQDHLIPLYITVPGDSFICAFHTASEAVQCALHIQQELLAGQDCRAGAEIGLTPSAVHGELMDMLAPRSVQQQPARSTDPRKFMRQQTGGVAATGGNGENVASRTAYKIRTVHDYIIAAWRLAAEAVPVVDVHLAGVGSGGFDRSSENGVAASASVGSAACIGGSVAAGTASTATAAGVSSALVASHVLAGATGRRVPWRRAKTLSRGGMPLCVFRGLRVRIGMASGVPEPSDVSYNTAEARYHYNGVGMRLARAVQGAAAGGMILLSDSTFAQQRQEQSGGGGGGGGAVRLPSALGFGPGGGGGGCGGGGGGGAAVLLSGALWLHMGQHDLHPDLPPQQVYQVLAAPLAGRLALFPPLSVKRCLAVGVLGAPVRRAAVAFVHAVGATSLLAWDVAVARQALGLLEERFAVELFRSCCGQGGGGGAGGDSSGRGGGRGGGGDGYILGGPAAAVAAAAATDLEDQQLHTAQGPAGSAAAAAAAVVPVVSAAVPKTHRRSLVLRTEQQAVAARVQALLSDGRLQTEP
ncbi:hypothetical protein VOLCADRAFT_92015 [Volvox carteri f. nagariensis]|uniref:Guanylate cyclase domain-containing protein n=1 Tax=Volvox carteri f. nagariensis TaxID=3068 RepID=D8TYV9_VOLCA|nr:uncharacterized protein VOLCADRAFT_92015 [Volvox carteri f. nagariensis]EFJ47381.1 hypothetical protein VOLCADRAFT_92015 [Volvox carteri f. nagariensis]|eukprot:XP_002951570.1 hypothetical protein VOLCADRAFT_92015 [Volvox carteri f. nagariensis]